MEAIIGDMPDIAVGSEPLESVEKDMHIGSEQVDGFTLCVLHNFLDLVDRRIIGPCERGWVGLLGIFCGSVKACEVQPLAGLREKTSVVFFRMNG
jgi:hypothetical protein